MAPRRGIHRRSRRISLRVPVRIYGRTPDDRPFRDVTETLAVSALGARLMLSVPVTPGQPVLLVHGITAEERQCRVAYVQPTRRGKFNVGLEFAHQRGNFWQIFEPLRRSKIERKEYVA